MIAGALKQVFNTKRYVVLSVVISFVVFTLAVWLPNFKIIIQVITSSTANLMDKWNLLTGLFGSISTNFTVVSASYTILIAILFGVNVSMVLYYMRRNKEISNKGVVASTGLVGIVSGFFGIGCSACGTLVLGPLLALVGGGWLIALLPFGGQEFGFLGVALLGFSIFLIAKKINAPGVCETEN